MVPNVTLESATSLAERLRTALEHEAEGVLSEVTASFGVALLAKGESFQQAIKLADDALYQAKANGRNQVVATRKQINGSCSAIC